MKAFNSQASPSRQKLEKFQQEVVRATIKTTEISLNNANNKDFA